MAEADGPEKFGSGGAQSALCAASPLRPPIASPLLHGMAASGPTETVTALQRFRAASTWITEQWPESAPPENWVGVKVKDGKVMQLRFTGTLKSMIMLPELPAEVGELVHLTQLEFQWCKKLVALPAEIGKLTQLQSLSLLGCIFVEALPPTIGQLAQLTTLDLTGCRHMTVLPGTIAMLSNLRTLKLLNCAGLTALPEQVGSLTALRTLTVTGCDQLVELPPEIGQLTSLSALHFDKCEQLKFPPSAMANSPVDEVVAFLAAHLVVMRDQYQQPINKWLTSRPKAITFFVQKIVTNDAYAAGLGRAVVSNPNLPELSTAKGEKAIDAACAACRKAMQGALHLLGRFEVDPTAPLHFSTGSAVLACTDMSESDGAKGGPPPRRALKCLRDEATVLAELKGRAGIDNGYVVMLTQVYVDSSCDKLAYDGKIPIEKVDNLPDKLADMLRKRRSMHVAGIGSSSGPGGGNSRASSAGVAEPSGLQSAHPTPYPTNHSPCSAPCLPRPLHVCSATALYSPSLPSPLFPSLSLPFSPPSPLTWPTFDSPRPKPPIHVRTPVTVTSTSSSLSLAIARLPRRSSTTALYQ